MNYWREKIVVVTGGAAGLGKTLAHHLARLGAHLVLADRDEPALGATTSDLPRAGGQARAVVTDITHQESVDGLFAEVDRHFGRLDALINCAGRSGRGELRNTLPEAFQQFLDINFLGTVRCTLAALPRLLPRRGHLVNVGSLAAKMAARYMGAYPVSKFAVAAFSQQLRLELAEQGLHVLLVCPGPLARDDAGRRYTEQAVNLPPGARSPGGGVRLKQLDPNYVARRILRACERRQPELVIPAKARILAAIAQLWPSLGDRIIRKMTDPG
ncbi:MAG: SDR family NAD(P)-dependent oxidoreductase [Planctomycetes bacterium]|nr:SDR family NAD(P)-dependent oxidoreductase [Planctomycetota bacterium]